MRAEISASMLRNISADGLLRAWIRNLEKHSNMRKLPLSPNRPEMISKAAHANHHSEELHSYQSYVQEARS